ncbi:DUF1801 domain-containing protein [Cellulomonas sp. GbtcB1]|uniref:DUF1801 domain-containing protein n=1 Tax=Cellulomonas sp. GbtcB1 TaxID=2824746 RepID=UPI001C310DE2|nr:DUF1801 domain-containing protein [Cellulomonas sp. GbtcB1]
MPDSPKTVPNDADVDAFLAAVQPERRRRDAVRARELLERITGEHPVLWGPSIVGFGSAHYRYASGHEGDWPPVAFSPRKTALTLYLMDGLEAHAADLAELGPHTTGTGCLYLKDLDAVDQPALERILVRSWDARGANPRS